MAAKGLSLGKKSKGNEGGKEKRKERNKGADNKHAAYAQRVQSRSGLIRDKKID